MLVGTELGVSQQSIVAADLDGDGHQDLAIGDPELLIDGQSVSAVHLLYGGADRLSGSVSLLERAVTWVGRAGEAGGVGHSIATGDVNDDGANDLVVAAPSRLRAYVLLGPR